MKSGKDRVKDTAKENRKGLSTANRPVRCDSHREVKKQQKTLIWKSWNHLSRHHAPMIESENQKQRVKWWITNAHLDATSLNAEERLSETQQQTYNGDRFPCGQSPADLVGIHVAFTVEFLLLSVNLTFRSLFGRLTAFFDGFPGFPQCVGFCAV